MTHARKYTIIDVETGELLNWLPTGYEECIGKYGAAALTGEIANLVHFREGSAIVWRDNNKHNGVWRALRRPDISFSQVARGEFSDKMRQFITIRMSETAILSKIAELNSSMETLARENKELKARLVALGSPRPETTEYKTSRKIALEISINEQHVEALRKDRDYLTKFKK